MQTVQKYVLVGVIIVVILLTVFVLSIAKGNNIPAQPSLDRAGETEALSMPMINSVDTAFYLGLAMGFLFNMMLVLLVSIIRGRVSVNREEANYEKSVREDARNQLLARMHALAERYDDTVRYVSESRRRSEKLLLPNKHKTA